MPKKKKQHGGARAGAGRKPASTSEGATVQIGVTVPSGLISKLDEVAQKKGWNRSQAITEAIRRLLKSVRM